MRQSTRADESAQQAEDVSKPNGDAVPATVNAPCPNCGKGIRFRAELAGKKVKCASLWPCRSPAIVGSGWVELTFIMKR